MKKAIIFGYHEVGCILIDELKKNKIKVSLIVGDYTKHNNQINSWYRDIREIAKKEKIKFIEKKKPLDKKTIKIIKQHNPDMIFCAFTNYILTEDIINIPKLGCYNFHNSDLPHDRGRGAPIYTLMKGKKKTAMTMHYISNKIDMGDVIDKEYIFIEKKDDIKRLYLKHNYALKKILDRQLIKLKKNKKLKSYSHKKKILPINLWIDGKSDTISFKNMTAQKIINIIYSLKYPFKGAKFTIKNKTVSIHDAEILRQNLHTRYKAGCIVKIDKYDLIVKTKKGFVKLKEFSYMGRNILPAHFAKIYNLKRNFVIG